MSAYTQSVIAKAADVFGVPRLRVGVPPYERVMDAVVYGLWAAGMDVITISAETNCEAATRLHQAMASMKISKDYCAKVHDVFWFAHHGWRARA